MFERVVTREVWLAERTSLLCYVAGVEYRLQQENKAVEEKGAQLRSVIDSIDDLIFLLDLKGIFIDYFQPANLSKLIVPPEHFFGKHIQEIMPSHTADVAQRTMDTVLTTKETQQFEYKLDEIDGEKWYSARISPWKHNTNHLTGFVVVVRNITKYIEAKKALRQRTNQFRALATRLADVQEAERQRLSRELHDRVGQSLTTLSINLNIIRSQIPEELFSLIQRRLDDSLLLVEQTAEQVRDVMSDLRPPILDDYGFVPALQWYGDKFSQRTGIMVSLVDKGDSLRVSSRAENNLFRITQEALTNVPRHAQATQVTISIVADEDKLRLVIADNGIGFDVVAPIEPGLNGGWGRLTMSERAEMVNGRCHIESTLGQGTRVIVEIKQ